jgi:hypothetical protein
MKEENIYDAFLNCLINKEFKTKEDYIAFKGAEFGANWQKQKQDEFAIEFGEWLLSRATGEDGLKLRDDILEIYKKEKNENS